MGICILRTHPVQRLVPDTCGEAAARPRRAHVCGHALVEREDLGLALIVLGPLGVFLVDEVHLVDEHPDTGIRAVFAQRNEVVFKVPHVSVPVLGRDVKDIDEDGDVGEDGVALGEEVVVQKGVLATTIPEVLDVRSKRRWKWYLTYEDKGAQQSDGALLHINGHAQALRVLGRIV